MKTDKQLLRDWVLFLKPDTISEDMVVVDHNGDDIHLQASVHYIEDLSESKTEFSVTDAHHAIVNIGTQPMADTRSDVFAIGNFQNRELFMSGHVLPIRKDGKHQVHISLFGSK